MDDKLLGVISSIKSVPQKRRELIEIIVNSARDLPGCLSYVVAEDLIDPDTIWITEIWDSEQSHGASLSSEKVRSSIMRARPIIEGVQQVARTNPLMGTMPSNAP